MTCRIIEKDEFGLVIFVGEGEMDVFSRNSLQEV